MKSLLFTSMLMLVSISTHAETTICDGKFENGQSVHVKIDWDKKNISVNDTVNKIRGINDLGNGVSTNTFKNTFGREVYFIIAHLKSGSDFIGQYSVYEDDNGSPIMMHWSALSCSKSFTKPFMIRMLAST